ncbi:MAG: glycoside hydrolase family 97 catalytic domain-containing protein [Halobacteriaceae archaeon]
MTAPTDPTGSVTARVDSDAGTVAVERDGRTVLAPSALGLPTPHGWFPDAFDLVDRTRTTVEQTARTAAGKARTQTHEATAATLAFEGEGGTAALDLRVAPDGAAYRYRIDGTGSHMLHGEGSEFCLPPGAVGWLSPYAANHEATVRELPADEAEGAYALPALFQVGADDWLLLAEAGVDGGYAAGRLSASAGDGARTYGLAHPPTSVSLDLPAATPWRVAIAGELGTVVESTLVPELVGTPAADPGADEGAVSGGAAVEGTARSGAGTDGAAVDGDPDWVEPGRVAWSWRAEPESPADPARQREYVEYAAERGWEYVLIDEGWSADWVPDLVADAADRGVGVFLWTHWTALSGADERARRLDRWADWGVDGVKVDFMDSDDQGRLQFYDRLFRAAADRELLVNVHGSVVPTGLRRRWPNVLTYEGVRGAEYYGWTTQAPAHNAALPFTRNVVGPMDYTPVTFTASDRRTSAGHELALAVVVESGLQHFADTPAAYAARPAAEWVLERVPAAWDETRFLRGRPGVEATVARRRGSDWFVGCVTAGPSRTIPVSLDFLSADREATVVRERPREAARETPSPADHEAAPPGRQPVDGDLVHETRSAPADGTLVVDVVENGGFVVALPA